MWLQLCDAQVRGDGELCRGAGTKHCLAGQGEGLSLPQPLRAEKHPRPQGGIKSHSLPASGLKLM